MNDHSVTLNNYSESSEDSKEVKSIHEEEDDLSLLSSRHKNAPEEKSELLNSIINSFGMSSCLIKLIIFGVLTCFADGSEMVVVSLIIRRLETKWNLTPLKKAFIGGSIFSGFLVGSLASGRLMDAKGRKFTIVLGSIIFLIFGISSSIATEFYSFFLIRLGVGLGIGFVIPTMQTFMTELSPQNYRGFNSIIIWLGFPLGEMYICYVSNLFPLDDETNHLSNWQFIMILAALPIFICIGMLFFIQESPRYHLLRNNFDEAFYILNLIKKENNKKCRSQNIFQSDQLDEKTKTDLKIYYIVKQSHNVETGYMSTLVPKFKLMSIKLWILWFVVSYIFYGVLYLIPELIGKQKDNVNFTDLINAVVFSTFFEIIGILSTLMIECDSIGRIGGFKISFVLSFFLSLLCMVKIRGWMFFLHILKGAIQISTRALYIYTSECYPTEIRGVALGLGNSFTRLAGLLTPLINEFLLSYTPDACFLGICVASVLASFISFTLKEETLNRKIE